MPPSISASSPATSRSGSVTALGFVMLLRLGLVLLLTATPVLAHESSGTAGGFVTGVLRPLLGLDRVAGMVGVGLWGAFLRRTIDLGPAGGVPARLESFLF